MAHCRLVTAIDPTRKCRLRVQKQQGWEVRGICPFPTGLAADRSVGGYRKGLSLIFSDPESPRDSANTKDLSHWPQHPAGRTPRPLLPPQPIQALDRTHLQDPAQREY